MLLLLLMCAVGHPVLRALLDLEQGGWRDGRYAAAARDLAAQLRTASGPQLQAALFQWLRCLVRADLRGPRGDSVQAALADLSGDTARLAGAFEHLAARLNPKRRPNLAAYLRNMIRWSANDIFRSEQGRHDQRSAALSPAVERRRSANPEARLTAQVVVDRLARHFADDPLAAGVIQLMLEGHNPTDIAARLDVSRPKVYRVMRTLRVWIEDGR